MRNGPYLLQLAPEDYPGKKYRDRYAYEHHLVWWQNTEETIDTEEFLIHHRNEDKHDNRFQNLEKMLREDHTREHAAVEETTTLLCDWCEIKYQRSLRYVKSKKKLGYKHSFCCRSHQVKYQHKYQRID